MPTRPGPYDPETTRLILTPSCSVTTKQVSPAFYEELDQEFDGFKGHVLIQTFGFSEAWPTWEVHPHGDEVVCLLSGAVDFILRTGDEDEVIRVDKPGTCVIVPQGTWHTARPQEPTVMLFITPGEGTLNAETPAP